ncbi:MAG: modification methylase, partial [Acidobacteriota bacterium]|nr:modification methylase [Acidobacteriota bacterium]
MDFSDFLPKQVRQLDDPQTALPRIAKDSQLVAQIEHAVRAVPTWHDLYLHDSREMYFLRPESVHLIITSPPYWTLKEYRGTEGQLGCIADYEQFLTELDKIWHRCFEALVPGGRLVCVVGDV